eukprot:7391813-Prymnesium_polylepis.7
MQSSGSGRTFTARTRTDRTTRAVASSRGVRGRPHAKSLGSAHPGTPDAPCRHDRCRRTSILRHAREPAPRPDALSLSA